jgi:hypothetical protein
MTENVLHVSLMDIPMCRQVKQDILVDEQAVAPFWKKGIGEGLQDLAEIAGVKMEDVETEI